jgi:hypothetical protein
MELVELVEIIAPLIPQEVPLETDVLSLALLLEVADMEVAAWPQISQALTEALLSNMVAVVVAE